MISIIQQVKTSLTNKRFVIFTILFPVIFYIFFIKQFNYINTKDTGMIALFSAMFGISGSGINTFSQKISKEKEYFQIMNKISPYSYNKYMFDSAIAQTFLNFLIIICITIVGLSISNLTINSFYVISISLLLYFGFYYIVIGFLLGTLFNDETLASASMPIFFLFMMFNITPNIMTTIKLPNFIIVIQKFFPGYYYNEALVNNTTDNILKALLMITIYIFIVMMITVFVNRRLKLNRK